MKNGAYNNKIENDDYSHLCNSNIKHHTTKNGVAKNKMHNNNNCNNDNNVKSNTRESIEEARGLQCISNSDSRLGAEARRAEVCSATSIIDIEAIRSRSLQLATANLQKIKELKS